MRFIVLAGLLLSSVSVVACGGVVGTVADEAPPARAEGASQPASPPTSAPVVAPTTDASVDAPPPPRADSGDPPTRCPTSATSRRRISFRVHNETRARVYLVGTGSFCDAFGVARPGQDPIPHSAGFNCGCECPQPLSGVAELRPLEPGATAVLEWDALSVTACPRAVDCSMWRPGTTAQVIDAIATPAPPASYEVVIPYTTTLPPDCSPDGRCRPGGGGPFNPGPLPPPLAPTCTLGAAPLRAGFALPAAGDFEVDVPIR